MLEQVKKTISRYNMFPAGSRVAVAVSGGPDSVCALLALVELAPVLGIQLSVAHFNHQLRGPESEADERFVADLASRLELPFYKAEGRVGDADDNLEQAARRARNNFFTGLMTKHEVDHVATGHTRDDQAETVLFRILRGTGLTGMAGILPVTKEGIVRPLLEVTRADVEVFLGERGAGWREDAMNQEQRFARNRIRSSLLPQLEREWNPSLGASLARMADLAFEEERWITGLVDAEVERLVQVRGDGLEFLASALCRLPLGLARRVARAAVGLAKGDLRGLEFGHIESLLALAQRDAGEGCVQLPGVTAQRSFDWLRITRQGKRECPVPSLKIYAPGTFVAPDGTQVSLAVEEPVVDVATIRANGARLKAAVLDWGNFAGLELRGWRVGDHYRPQGRSRDEKVSEMFQRARVPSWQRPHWPIVTYGEEILWAKTFGPAAEFAADADTVRVLRIFTSDDAGEGGGKDDSEIG